MQVHICTIYVPDDHAGQKRVSDNLEMELQTVVSHHMGAGNLTQVLCKNNKCS